MPACDLCKSGADLAGATFIIKPSAHQFKGFALMGTKICNDSPLFEKTNLCETCRKVLGGTLYLLINGQYEEDN